MNEEYIRLKDVKGTVNESPNDDKIEDNLQKQSISPTPQNKSMSHHTPRSKSNLSNKSLSNITPSKPENLSNNNISNQSSIKKEEDKSNLSFDSISKSLNSSRAEHNIFKEKEKLRSVLDIIEKSYANNQIKIENKKISEVTKKKIFLFTKLIRTKNLLLKTIKNQVDNEDLYLFVMHPELSQVRIFLDFIAICIILYDSFYTPYYYFVRNKDGRIVVWEIFVDIILSIDIFSNFFTAYFNNQILIKDYRSIFFHYIKLKFWIDILYIIPSNISRELMYMRMVKLYKLDKILKRIRSILMKLFNLCIKNLKLIHSITNIFIFTIYLLYIIHMSACIFVFIGNQYDKKGWNFNSNNGNLIELTPFDMYVASAYLLMETFTTIGYGDINPKNIGEVVFLMICEVLNVGLFAYLISCIMDIITKLTSDEISFKIQNDVDINAWLLKYNNKVPDSSKNKMEKQDSSLYENVQKYFLLYYKNDNLWIKNFEFLKQMRPDLKNKLLNHLYFSLFSTFYFFFNELEDNFKFMIALNLKSKVIEHDEIIISENNTNTSKNKIKYIYLIGKGCVSISKENKEISSFDAGSYFGDEYFLNETPLFTYKNAKEMDLYLFCCPLDIIKEICNYYEESYLMLLIKTIIRFSKIRFDAEKLGIKFTDKNNEFLRKIYKQYHNAKGFNKMNNVSYETNKNDHVSHNLIIHNGGSKQIEMKQYPLNSPAVILKESPQNEISSEFKRNQNQIFSKDEISINNEDLNEPSLKNNEIGLNNIILNEELNEELNPIEKEVLLDNLNFLEKLDFNENLNDEIVNLKNQVDEMNNLNNYLSKLLKKLNFLDKQIDFLKSGLDSVEEKTGKVIQQFENNKTIFFN